MKRQKIRKLLLFLSFLLFPVTLYYLSPYLIINGGFEGVITGSFLVFASMFLASLFFGRAFCGWICPAGGLMDHMTSISDKRCKGGKRNWIKYFIWAPWMITIVLAFITAGGVMKIDFPYFTQYGISVSNPVAYIMYYFVIGLFFVFGLIFGRRAGCHYLCWMAPFMVIGNIIPKRLKYPSLHLEAQPDSCVNCKVCSKQCPMSLEVHEMVQKKNMYHSECILCGVCVDSCSKKAIAYKFRTKK